VSDKIVTRANAVTALGVAATTFYIFQFWYGFLVVLIPVVILIAFKSDCWDGVLADKYNEHTKIGKKMDIFRDRYITVALLMNIWMIGDSRVCLPVLIVMGLETVLWMYSEGGNLSVHIIEKARSTAHWIVGYLVIVQYYWIGSTFVSSFFLTWMMALLSIAAYFYYTPRYLKRGEGE